MQESTIKEGIWANDRTIRFEWRNRHSTNESGEVFNTKFETIKGLGKDE